ncbi:MAG: VWA domain-containing protein [Bryobacterales bacterium]|nr:VWA domain-containing protein [Bryobacteraceae bacterium]MDW8130447.1 VWA domain-containing protein [Bryobacterales bacterium]
MVWILLACILALPLGAQPGQEPIFRAGVDVVVVPTIVLDRNGNFVHGLERQDFLLLDNGKPQDIRVDVTFIPISLVVAVQANSAVEVVLPKVRKLGTMLHYLVAGEQGEVAVIAFDHRVQLVQDFTTDTDKIQQALAKLRPGSTSSAMVDAVLYGIRMLRRRPENRRRILLLISETRDQGSEARKRDVLEAAQFANVVVYSININRLVTTLTAKPQPPRPDPFPPAARPLPAGVPATPHTAAQVTGNPTNSANFVPVFVEIFRAVRDIFVDNPVELFTKWTGGTEHPFITQEQLERAVRRIGEELHSQYIISYTPNNRDEGGFHEIQVLVRGRNDVRVITRPGYWMAAQPSGN